MIHSNIDGLALLFIPEYGIMVMMATTGFYIPLSGSYICYPQGHVPSNLPSIVPPPIHACKKKPANREPKRATSDNFQSEKKKKLRKDHNKGTQRELK